MYSTVRITDRFGIDYSDLFADVAFTADTIDELHDTVIVNDPRSPRANEDGPLGALIVRWIQARVESPNDIYSCQYIDAADVHTIAYVHRGAIHFLNIFGSVEQGKRVYQLGDLAHALGLQIDVASSGGAA